VMTTAKDARVCDDGAIVRREDGSIECEYYLMRARRLRAEAATATAVALPGRLRALRRACRVRLFGGAVAPRVPVWRSFRPDGSDPRH